MPSQSFALVPNGPKSLTLSWKLFWKDFTVTLDGRPVATLTPDEVKSGKEIALPDGSRLHIHFKQGLGNNGLQLLRNGQPLPGAQNDPHTMVKNAAYLLYFIAALNVLLGAAVVAFDVRALADLGFGWANIVQGFLFAVGGFFTMQRSQVALILSIAMYVLDYVATFLLTISEGGKPAAGGIVVRIIFTVVLIRGLSGIRQLKAGAPTAA
jgi:hypothetical protein